MNKSEEISYIVGKTYKEIMDQLENTSARKKLKYKKFKKKFSDKSKYQIITSKNESNGIDYIVLEKEDVFISKNLSPLTPIEDTNRYNSYIKTFEYLYQKDQYLNIGISGTYGSGKSSLIKVLRDEDFIGNSFSISLSDFRGEGILDKNNLSKSRLDMIEIKILRQLYYQSDFSHTKVLRTTNWQEVRSRDILKKMFGFSLILIFMMYYLSLWRNLYFDKGVTSWLGLIYKFLDLCSKDFFSPIVIQICIGTVIILSFIWYLIRKYYLKIRFGIVADNLNIEMESQKDDISAISEGKYLHELMYILKYNNVDTIFIEDLDRFENTDILAGLREINYLINSYNRKRSFLPYKLIKKYLGISTSFSLTKLKKSLRGNNMPIRFIYAIRDDVFSEYDRLKFFDIIVPIIPIANTSNSFFRMTEALVSNYPDIMLRLDNDLVRKVCDRIWDMRMINEIANEFVIFLNEKFRNEIEDNVTEEVLNQLFCLIVFKVKYPKEYKLLSQDKGIFYESIKVGPDYRMLHMSYIHMQPPENKESAEEMCELISMFLDGSYVDTSYRSAMTYSRLDTLDEEDRAFFFTVLEEQNIDLSEEDVMNKMNYEIRNKVNFVDFIMVTNIADMKLWNISLLSQMCHNMEKGYGSSIKCDEIIKNMLKDLSVIDVKIILKAFYQRSDFTNECMIELLKKMLRLSSNRRIYIDIYDFVEEKYPTNQTLKDDLLRIFLEFASIENIKEYSVSDIEELKEILSTSWDYICENLDEHKEFIEKLNNLLKPKYLINLPETPSETQMQFINNVIEENCYDLSCEVLKSILVWILKDEYDENLSIVGNCKKTVNDATNKILLNIERNFQYFYEINYDKEPLDEDYVIWLLENLEEDEESEKTVKDILNKYKWRFSKFPSKTRINYKRCFQCIENSNFPSSLEIYSDIATNKKIDNRGDFDDQVADRINSRGIEIIGNIKDSIINSFTFIIKNNSIKNDYYEIILKCLSKNRNLKKISMLGETLDRDKVLLLVKYKLLAYDKGSFDLLDMVNDKQLFDLYLLLMFDELKGNEIEKVLSEGNEYVKKFYDKLLVNNSLISFKVNTEKNGVSIYEC